MMDDVERDRPLFDQKVPVSVKFPDEMKDIDLILRVLRGSREPPHGKLRQSQREHFLRIEITDDRDPFFLFSLEVGEEDYHELKRDQRLLVDFSTFPRNLIEMLEQCGSSPLAITDPEGTSDPTGLPSTPPKKLGDGRVGHSAPRSPGDQSVHSAVSFTSGMGQFSARLETQGGTGSEAIFSIVESNPFRELVHLGLRMRPATDSELKMFLAQRLGQMKRKGVNQAEKVLQLETQLGEERLTNRAMGRELEAIQTSRQQELRELRSAHALELSKLRDDLAEKSERMSVDHNQHAMELQRRMDETTKELKERLEAFEKKCEELNALKFSNEGQMKEDEIKIKGLEKALNTTQRELGECRAENVHLERQRHELEKEVHGLQVTVASLEQQTSDKSEALQKASLLQKAAEGQNKQATESLELYKQNVASLQSKLEASVEEIKKGNQIISKIQSEYRTSKSKLKLKGDVIRQQERIIEDQKTSYQELRSKFAELEREMTIEKERSDRLRRDLQDANTKLQESNQLIESNQQVISWLNKEINESQLGRTGFNLTGDSLPVNFQTTPALKTPGILANYTISPDKNSKNQSNTPLLFGTASNLNKTFEGSTDAIGPLGTAEGDSFLKQAMQKYGVRGSFGTK